MPQHHEKERDRDRGRWLLPLLLMVLIIGILVGMIFFGKRKRWWLIEEAAPGRPVQDDETRGPPPRDLGPPLDLAIIDLALPPDLSTLDRKKKKSIKPPRPGYDDDDSPIILLR